MVTFRQKNTTGPYILFGSVNSRWKLIDAIVSRLDLMRGNN